MPLFRYKAATAAGQLLEGEMEARSEEVVIRRLQSQGHIPIRAAAVTRSSDRMQAPGLQLLQPRHVTARDVSVLTLELSTLLQAGLTLDRSLEVLTGLAEREPVRELLARLQSAVRGGASLSTAMEAEGRIFSGFYRNMVRAGEAGGALETTLAKLSEFLQRSRELKDAVSAALIYPIILLAVALISVSVILGFVVPRFAEMFADAGQSLPVPTLVVVAVGGFVAQYGWALALLIAATCLYLRRELAKPERRLAWDRRLLQLPLIGDLVSKIETARFTRTLETLLTNGVNLVSALDIAKEIIGNRCMAEKVGRSRVSVREGKGLTKALLEANALPKLAGELLQVGEETGNLEGMLRQLAEIYEREVKTAVQRLVALVEPVLILGLGLLIAGIILSLLVAILGVNELGV